MLKVATYCRVSTSKDDQINSFDRQMQMYEEEIYIHDDWELYKAYCDKGISGTDVLNRPGFLEMINDGLNGEFDVLITREVSRLSRNIQQFYEFVRSLVKKGINIYFIDDEINTLMPDFEIRAAGIISHAQDESRKTSQRVKRGQLIAMKNGIVHGTSMLGYDLRDGKLFINENGAETVKMIYDMYVNKNLGIRQIKRKLEKLGIKTYKGNDIWNIKSILNILKNEKYCGDLLQRKTCTIDYLTHKKIKNAGEKIHIVNHHEPIISREVWNEAQKKLSKKNKNKKSNTAKYILSGKIKCGECQKNFVSRTRNNSDGLILKTWKCSSAIIHGKKKSHEYGCDNSKQLRNDVAMDMVKKAINKLELNEEYLKNEILHILRKTLKPSYKQNFENIISYQNKLNFLKKAQEKILNDELFGIYSLDVIKEKTLKIDNEISIIRKKINFLNSENPEAINYNEFEKNVIEYLKKFLEYEQYNDNYIRFIIKNITVFKNQTAIVSFNFLDENVFFNLY